MTGCAVLDYTTAEAWQKEDGPTPSNTKSGSEGATPPVRSGRACMPALRRGQLEQPQQGRSAGHSAAAGSSEQEYYRRRWNMSRFFADRIVMVVFMAMHIVSALHNRSIYFRTPANATFTLAWPTALALCLRWMVTAPASYARWREVPATLMPMAGCLTSVTWEIMEKTLSDVSVWQEGRLRGAALFWSALLFGSMIPNILVAGLAWHKRLAWHCSAQALYAALLLRHVPAVCEAPLLQLPASQRQIGGLHSALRTLGSLVVGRAAMAQQLPAGVQCKGLLAALVLMLGFALPAALAAAYEREEWAYFAYGSAHGSAQPSHSDSGDGDGSSPGQGQLLLQQQQQQRGLASWGAVVSEACCRFAVFMCLVLLTLMVWDGCVAWYLHSPTYLPSLWEALRISGASSSA